jgi:hypothetical protein
VSLEILIRIGVAVGVRWVAIAVIVATLCPLTFPPLMLSPFVFTPAVLAAPSAFTAFIPAMLAPTSTVPVILCMVVAIAIVMFLGEYSCRLEECCSCGQEQGKSSNSL